MLVGLSVRTGALARNRLLKSRGSHTDAKTVGAEPEAASDWSSGRRGWIGRVGRAAVGAVFAAGTCALCGCAGPRVSRAGAAAVDRAPQRGFASGVNLRVGDLPGAQAVAPEGAGPSPGAKSLGFSRCDRGVSPDRIVRETRSALLSVRDGSLLVRSRVTVWPNGGLATRNLAALASKRGSRCELRYGGTAASTLTSGLPGGARALGVRIVVPSRSGHAGEIGYHDIIGFVVGPAEIVLTAAGFSRPLERQTERRLLDLLYRRAGEARSELEALA